jgi:hypothetical protein
MQLPAVVIGERAMRNREHAHGRRFDAEDGRGLPRAET